MKIITFIACLSLLSIIVLGVQPVQEAFADDGKINIDADKKSYSIGDTVNIKGHATNDSFYIIFYGFATQVNAVVGDRISNDVNFDFDMNFVLNKYKYDNKFGLYLISLRSTVTGEIVTTTFILNNPECMFKTSSDGLCLPSKPYVHQVTSHEDGLFLIVFNYSDGGSKMTDISIESLSKIGEWESCENNNPNWVIGNVLTQCDPDSKHFKIKITNEIGDSEWSNVFPSINTIVTVKTEKSKHLQDATLKISGNVTYFDQLESVSIEIFNQKILKSDFSLRLDGDGKFFRSIQLLSNSWDLGEYTVKATYKTKFTSQTTFEIVQKLKFLEIEVNGKVDYGETLEIKCNKLKSLPIDSSININIKNDKGRYGKINQNLTFNNSTLNFTIPDNFHSKYIWIFCILIDGEKESVESKTRLSLPDADGDFVPDEHDKCPIGDDRDDLNGNGIPSKCDPDERPTLYSLQKNGIPNYDRNTKNITIDYDYDVLLCATRIDGAINSFTITNNDEPFDNISVNREKIIPCKGTMIINATEYNPDKGGFTLTIPMYNATKIIDGNSTKYLVDTGRNNLIDEIIIKFRGGGSSFNEKSSRDFSSASIGMDLYVHKLTTYMFDTDLQQFSLIYPSSSEIKKGGGGGCADCVPPTLGLNQNFVRVVDYGFSYNGNKVQVDKWYTEFPLIEVNVGEENLLEAKVYENNGINNMKWIQACFGATEKGMSLDDCEALVTIHLESNGTTEWIGIEKVVIVDKDNLLDNILADVYVTDCENTPSSENPRQCVKLDLYHTFREAPLNNMVIINVSDKPRNAQNFHFNHGIEVHGVSLNGEPTITLFEKHSSQDNVDNWNTYTRDSKVNNTWTDENGIQYQKINDHFLRLTPLPEIFKVAS